MISRAHFFGINDGSFVPLTYTFDDLVKALNAVEPYDWAGFLRQRLDGIARPAPLDGLAAAAITSSTPTSRTSTRRAARAAQSHHLSVLHRRRPR